MATEEQLFASEHNTSTLATHPGRKTRAATLEAELDPKPMSEDDRADVEQKQADKDAEQDAGTFRVKPRIPSMVPLSLIRRYGLDFASKDAMDHWLENRKQMLGEALTTAIQSQWRARGKSAESPAARLADELVRVFDLASKSADEALKFLDRWCIEGNVRRETVKLLDLPEGPRNKQFSLAGEHSATAQGAEARDSVLHIADKSFLVGKKNVKKKDRVLKRCVLTDLRTLSKYRNGCQINFEISNRATLFGITIEGQEVAAYLTPAKALPGADETGSEDIGFRTINNTGSPLFFRVYQNGADERSLFPGDGDGEGGRSETVMLRRDSNIIPSGRPVFVSHNCQFYAR